MTATCLEFPVDKITPLPSKTKLVTHDMTRVAEEGQSLLLVNAKM